ncbi:nucleoside monophosphate kinase [Candidatus Azambacteria bacterium]|nr:nucleoside monophosphate kinase [Candidatus Azambacteria bacterium]
MKDFDLIILGRPGSGKGTQAEILTKKYGFEWIQTGALVRKFAEGESFAARKVKAEAERGDLTPSWFVSLLWLQRLIETPETSRVLFDGSPRKIWEAELLDEVLEWFEREMLRTLLIDISVDEAKKRLTLRGRIDDATEKVERRLALFDQELVPVIGHYEKKGVLIRINGEQSVEEVAKEIAEKLGLA